MYIVFNTDRIEQGCILKNVEVRNAYDDGNDVVFDFSIVVSQDCDLEQDYNGRIDYGLSQKEDYEPPKGGAKLPDNDKYINQIIIVPAFTALVLKEGNHLTQLGRKMQYFDRKKLWPQVLNNNNLRYHYLEGDPNFGIPDLVLDFKHMYTLPRVYLYEQDVERVARLEDLYSVDVSLRLSSFISRVGLPSPVRVLS